jgi:hypothetical protein
VPAWQAQGLSSNSSNAKKKTDLENDLVSPLKKKKINLMKTAYYNKDFKYQHHDWCFGKDSMVSRSGEAEWWKKEKD